MIGFGFGCGDGFFDKDIDACLHELFGGGGVVDGGDADAGGVYREVGCEGFGDGGEAGDGVEFSGGREGCGVAVDDGDEFYVSLHLEFFVDAQVVLAEGSCPGYRDSQGAGAGV